MPAAFHQREGERLARTLAELPKDTRIMDHISLPAIAKAFAATVIEEILRRTGRSSRRRRWLPARVVVYYVIALPLIWRYPTARSCAIWWKDCAGRRGATATLRGVHVPNHLCRPC